VFADSHCHLYHPRLEADRDEVVARALDAGVTTIFLPATDLATVRAALDLAERYDGVCYAMAGVHPCDVQHLRDGEWDAIEALAHDPRIVAIGETGLDHYWSRDFDDLQDAMLRRHLRLAADTGKPIVLHTRNADDVVLRVVAEERSRLADPSRLTGVFHCWSGTAEQAAEAMALGFCVGVGGSATYKNSPVFAALADVSLERIVLETDAPFLAPVPKRGQRNEPSFLVHTAAALAEARGVSVEDVARITTAATHRLYGIAQS